MTYCSVLTFERSEKWLAIIATFVTSIFIVVPMTYAQGRGPSPVKVAEVLDDVVHPTQEFVGTVLPERQAAIGSAVDGRVNEFLVRDGDRVEAGQPLAKLLDDTISMEIAAAEAELEFRTQELNELERGSLPAEKSQAAELLNIAEARLAFAQKDFERTSRLYEQAGAANEKEFDEAKVELNAATATVAERKAAKQLIDDGPRLEKILQAKAQQAMQAAIVQKLKDQKNKHTIRTRFSGYVIAEQTEEGEWVNRGDLVAEIVALDHVLIEVHVLESYIQYVQQGMHVDVWIPALPFDTTSEGKQPFSGEVVHIIPSADPRSRTFPVKIRVKNLFLDDHPLIKAGMVARVVLPIGDQRNERLIPKDALVLGGQTPFVWVVDPSPEKTSGTVKKVTVQPGISDGRRMAIGQELTPGQLVVIEGNERLQPGAEVSILNTLQN